jgi:hypothetical protein
MAKITVEGVRDKYIIEADADHIHLNQRRDLNHRRDHFGQIVETIPGPSMLAITVDAPYTIKLADEEAVKSDQPELMKQTLAKMKFIAK